MVPVGNKIRELFRHIPRTCETCGKTVMLDPRQHKNAIEVMEQHKAECPMVQIYCPNLVHGCEHRFPRGQLTAHIRGECKHVPCKGFVGFIHQTHSAYNPANLFSSPQQQQQQQQHTRVETPRTQRRNDGRRAMAIPSQFLPPNPYPHECDASTSSPNDAKSVYRKLGCDFVGTYAQAARHFSCVCSRKEHDPLMADIRDLYAQYCAYRVQSYEATSSAPPHAGTPRSVSTSSTTPSRPDSTLEGNDPTCRTLIDVMMARDCAPSPYVLPSTD